MPITYISPESQAYVDGYRDGRSDRILGWRSEYAWFTESVPSYTRSYSLGYHAGWLNLPF